MLFAVFLLVYLKKKVEEDNKEVILSCAAMIIKPAKLLKRFVESSQSFMYMEVTMDRPK